MEIVNALADGIIPVTEGLVDIARTCTLCGICDKQCYYLMELRPMKVMEALKEYVESYLRENKPVEKPEEDQVLRDLRKIEIIKIASKHGVSLVARGTGQNLWGMALGEGIIIDLGRMKRIEIDYGNWTATVQAGVTAFDLQVEVAKCGMMANVAEPAAYICANTLQPMFSTFAHSWGFTVETFVDAEIVTFDGKAFKLNDKDAPNLFSFSPPTPGGFPSPLE
jgi:hypothetical protein